MSSQRTSRCRPSCFARSIYSEIDRIDPQVWMILIIVLFIGLAIFLCAGGLRARVAGGAIGGADILVCRPPQRQQGASKLTCADAPRTCNCMVRPARVSLTHPTNLRFCPSVAGASG